MNIDGISHQKQLDIRHLATFDILLSGAIEPHALERDLVRDVGFKHMAQTGLERDEVPLTQRCAVLRP